MFSSASERNKQPIYETLQSRMQLSGSLLELASGSMQHALYMAPGLPNVHWCPTDIDRRALIHSESIRATLPANVSPMTRLDVTELPWKIQFESIQTIYTANLLHISPWPVTESLFKGARQKLATAGDVFIYGPFSKDGIHNSEGNRAFDSDLKSRNLEWGIRDLNDVERVAKAENFALLEQVAMPANNFLLHFRIC